jgi:hypothetical protein
LFPVKNALAVGVIELSPVGTEQFRLREHGLGCLGCEVGRIAVFPEDTFDCSAAIYFEVVIAHGCTALSLAASAS